MPIRRACSRAECPAMSELAQRVVARGLFDGHGGYSFDVREQHPVETLRSW